VNVNGIKVIRLISGGGMQATHAYIIFGDGGMVFNGLVA